MDDWAMKELGQAEFGDARLTNRLVRIVTDLSAQPLASVPMASGNPASTKAVYRFWDSPSVTPPAIFEAHRLSTIDRIANQPSVLVVQDTTSLDFSSHSQTNGLGPLDHPSRRGVKVHSALVVSLQGVPLGLVHQQVWARDPAAPGKSQRRRSLTTAEKESQRWLTTLAATQAALPVGLESITVADREADIFDLFAAPRQPGSHLLIRATHNRRVEHDAEYLWAAVRESPSQGQLTVDLRRQVNRPARQASLTIRYLSLTISPPRHHRQRATLQPITVQVALAEEETPPANVAPVTWLLITTLPLESYEQAVQVITWYSYRWLIERYHFVLKSGCQVEKLQLEDVDRLGRALATYCIVAWRLLWLTYEARRQPDVACNLVLQVHEWQALYATIHKTTKVPTTPPTLRQTIRWIAQLGGFLGRKGDGEPGVMALWRGLSRLNDIAATWLLLTGPLSPA